MPARSSVAQHPASSGRSAASQLRVSFRNNVPAVEEPHTDVICAADGRSARDPAPVLPTLSPSPAALAGTSKSGYRARSTVLPPALPCLNPFKPVSGGADLATVRAIREAA
eukprot:EG_transcript_42526